MIKPIPQPMALTYAEAGERLRVSADYVRRSDIPKVYLPGSGPKGRPVPRILATDLEAWLMARTKSRAA